MEDLYKEAIMRRVCSHCMDFGEDGICHSQDPEGCAIFRFLPELVSIANRIHEPKIGPYIDAVRSEICQKCPGQGTEGSKCPIRDSLECSLDRYLPLVLEAVEEVDRQL